MHPTTTPVASLRAIVPLALVCTIALPHAAPASSRRQLAEWAVVNVAHRGGIVPGYPENTLSAFRRALAIGVDAIELDLRGTKDGEVVILHDETLDRTTDGSGLITSHTLAEVRRLDAGSGERVPTYEEVLELVSGTGVTLLLDIKVSDTLDKRHIVRVTERYGAVLTAIAGVRTLDDLREFRSLNPNLRTLGFVESPEQIDAFVAGGVDIIRVWPDWIRVDPAIVQHVQHLGKPVWTTAADAPRAELERLIGLGVNGILSDYPGVMSTVLETAQRQR